MSDETSPSETPAEIEVSPWEEVRNFDEEIYVGYWHGAPLLINVDFGACFLAEGQGLAVGDGAYFAKVAEGTWNIAEADSFPDGLLPKNSILSWEDSETYHQALGVVSAEEKETQRMMEMIQAQMAQKEAAEALAADTENAGDAEDVEDADELASPGEADDASSAEKEA